MRGVMWCDATTAGPAGYSWVVDNVIAPFVKTLLSE